MKLDALAGRDAQGVIAVSGRNVVKYAPLISRHDSARNAPAHHHDEFLAGLAQVAIILLIAAMEFQEFPVVIAKKIRGWVRDSGRDGPREGGNCSLDVLVMR